MRELSLFVPWCLSVRFSLAGVHFFADRHVSCRFRRGCPSLPFGNHWCCGRFFMWWLVTKQINKQQAESRFEHKFRKFTNSQTRIRYTSRLPSGTSEPPRRAFCGQTAGDVHTFSSEQSHPVIVSTSRSCPARSVFTLFPTYASSCTRGVKALSIAHTPVQARHRKLWQCDLVTINLGTHQRNFSHWNNVK